MDYVKVYCWIDNKEYSFIFEFKDEDEERLEELIEKEIENRFKSKSYRYEIIIY